MAARKLPKILTREQAHALLETPNLDAPTGLRDRVAMELMYRAGLRISEVCGVHLRDYRPADGQLHIRCAVAKGGREDYAYLEPKTCDLIDRWKSVRRTYANGSALLLVTLTGHQLNRTDMWKMMRRRARKAGIEHAHPHMLRHTYATELLGDGFTLREVQRLLRHADIRTTAIYLHVNDRELAAKVKGRPRGDRRSDSRRP